MTDIGIPKFITECLKEVVNILKMRIGIGMIKPPIFKASGLLVIRILDSIESINIFFVKCNQFTDQA